MWRLNCEGPPLAPIVVAPAAGVVGAAAAVAVAPAAGVVGAAAAAAAAPAGP